MDKEIGELRVLITAQADKFNSEIAKVQSELSAMGKATSKISAKTFALGNILGQVATKAFGTLVNVVKEGRQAYNDLAASQTKLATVMQQRGALQQEYDDLIKLTEAEERLGVVSATVQQNGLQELATYVGQSESLQKLTNVMNNLIVQQHGYNATADHALQTATMMGKVLQGQTGGLERIGYHLSEDEKAIFTFGTEEERVATLTAIVNDNLGDMNRRLGETNVGKQVQLANTWAQLKAQVGELATTIGNVLIPAFSAVANVIGRAISYVKAFLKLLGVETGNAASQTASSVSDASDAVSGYGDAASNAAKKVKKSLAAFDEMNTLAEQSGSDDDSGGLDILEGLEASASQIDWGSIIPDIELPDWLKQLGNIFSDIDTERLKGAFSTLWEDIKAGAGPVMQAVDDLWNNYLKPFVTWTGNELFPSFLNAIGGAIQFVGGLIQSMWDVALKPFIDSFLVPIAQWTGGVVVKVLNAIGDGLRAISKNKTLMDVIAKGLTAVGTALAVAKVTKFFKAFSDGITIFKTVKGLTGSVAEAFGAVTSNTTGLVSVFSNLGGNVAQTLSNGLELLKSGFSTLWGVISAHPIITLIAVLGTLLLTNENFRESLGNLLNSVLAPIKTMLDSLFGVIEPILTILSNLLNIVLTPIIGIVELIADALAVVFDALSPFIETITQIMIAFSPLNILLEALKPILDGISAAIEVVSGAISGLFGWLGNLFGITNDNTEATENYTRALSEEQKQYDKNGDGALDYSENLLYLRSVIDGTNKAESDLIQAQKNQVKMYQNLDQFCQKYGKTADELIELHRKGELGALDAGDALNELTMAVIDVESANYQVISATEKFNDEQGELQSAANQTKEKLDEAGQELLKLGEQGTTSGDKWNELTRQIEEYGKQIKETGKNVGEIRNWEGDAREAAARVGQGAVTGLKRMEPAWAQANADFAITGNNAFQQYYIIKSPSRLMRKNGKYIGEGAIEGVEGTYGEFADAMSGLAEVGEEAFNTDLSANGLAATTKASVDAMLELDSLGETIAKRIVIGNKVVIGSETFYDDIRENLNDFAQLTNQPAVNI